MTQKAAVAELLRVEMARQNIRTIDLAARSGVSAGSIGKYRTGKYVPLPGTLAALADALMCPRLRELGTTRIRCEECPNEYEVEHQGGHPRRYCSPRCQSRALGRRRRYKAASEAQKLAYQLRTARHESEDRRLAILANCLDCAGESKVCPLIKGCVFIPVTELPKRRRKAA